MPSNITSGSSQVKDNVGRHRISKAKESDIKCCKFTVDAEYIRHNPSDGVLTALKKSCAFDSEMLFDDKTGLI